MKKITVEEHFATEEYVDQLRAIVDKTYSKPEVYHEEKFLYDEFPFLQSSYRDAESNLNMLLDLGAGRIREMDKCGIAMQVLSFISPGVQVFDAATGSSMAKKINDRLGLLVKEHPDRFVGLASIAPQNPQEAADELERAVTELGLKGASINSHVKGEYLDDKKYWVIFERAEKLGVPIYLHPRCPSAAMIKPYLGYPMVPTAMCGFAAETALHALRLICGGVFHRYPNLNIILGHLGEALPYWFWRLDNMWQRGPLAKELGKTPSEYFRDNFFITTSGIFYQPAFMCAYLALGAEKILFAVDYPMELIEEAVHFIEAVPICKADQEKVCYLNAEKLFDL